MAKGYTNIKVATTYIANRAQHDMTHTKYEIVSVGHELTQMSFNSRVNSVM